MKHIRSDKQSRYQTKDMKLVILTFVADLLIMRILEHNARHWVSSQPMMMLSGQRRGVKVRRMGQKLLSLVHLMTWWKSGNGKCLFLTLLVWIIFFLISNFWEDSLHIGLKVEFMWIFSVLFLQVRWEAGAAVDSGGPPAGGGVSGHQSQRGHRCLQLPRCSHSPLGPGVWEADQIHGCWTRSDWGLALFLFIDCTGLPWRWWSRFN